MEDRGSSKDSPSAYVLKLSLELSSGNTEAAARLASVFSVSFLFPRLIKVHWDPKHLHFYYCCYYYYYYYCFFQTVFLYIVLVVLEPTL